MLRRRLCGPLVPAVPTVAVLLERPPVVVVLHQLRSHLGASAAEMTSTRLRPTRRIWRRRHCLGQNSRALNQVRSLHFFLLPTKVKEEVEEEEKKEEKELNVEEKQGKSQEEEKKNQKRKKKEKWKEEKYEEDEKKKEEEARTSLWALPTTGGRRSRCRGRQPNRGHCGRPAAPSLAARSPGRCSWRSVRSYRRRHRRS